MFRSFKLRIIFLLTFIFTINSKGLLAQGDFTDLYTYKPNSNCSVTIKVKKSKIRCEDATDVRRVNNKISIENSASLEGELNSGRIGRYLSWNFEIIKCNGERWLLPISIDLTNYSNEGLNDLIDYTFEAKDFILIGGSVKNSPSFQKPVKLPDPNIAPSFISGPNEVYAGDLIELTAIGGVAMPGSKYVWTEGSCNGKVILGAETSILKVKATNVSKKYFVHISNGLNENTTCASIEVKVLTISKKADRVIGPNFVCSNSAKKITLEVSGGKLGENTISSKAEWVWRLNSEDGPEIMRGQKITIDQPKTPTTYFVSPEGVNKVESISHQIQIFSPSDISNAKILKSSTIICQGQNTTLELYGAILNNQAEVNWYESNVNHSKKKISNDISFITSPSKTSTYSVNISDQCITTPELQTIVTVNENSVLPSHIQIDSSKNGRLVKLFINDSLENKINLKNTSNWIWYIPNYSNQFNEQKKPINTKILNSGSTSIDFKAIKTTTVALKAFGECESNQNVQITIPKRLDKYWFITLGTSSNDMGSLPTKVLTLGGRRIYFRTKQSLNLTTIGNYKLNSLLTDGKTISNFPTNSGTYYTFNGEKVNVTSSYTMGFFVNQNDVKIYLGGGFGSQSYYNGIDISAYQQNTPATKSWAQNINYNNSGIEIESGISIKLKPFYLMAGVSYLMGTSPSKGYISANLNIGFAFGK